MKLSICVMSGRRKGESGQVQEGRVLGKFGEVRQGGGLREHEGRQVFNVQL